MAPRTPQPPEHLRNLARGRVAKREELTLLEGNPNQGDVEMVARSLLRFGQKTPIVLSPEGVVVKGNTTTQAADLLASGGLDGLDPLPEWNELWVIDDEEEDVGEQLAYALADNRTARAGEDDPALLLAMLDRIPERDGIGYDADDIADLRAALQENGDDYWGGDGVHDDEPSFPELGRPQQPASWWKGRLTKVDNLVGRWADHVVRISADDAPERVAARLTETLLGAVLAS